ncbi:DNA polymerase zeta catalytic subunit [Anopheles ziemanni]|uniref:DNA polymerase zeta catalytic subunit n=1 Tax=Anopheles ziemanni TaxID=345580 RepID=UPI00265D6F4B|nr:DNA polymerase zeta catalytic subunit [Anopheles ziemanni]
MYSTNATSVRIVSVDHYMAKPDTRFDVCYSQFRGTEIRQVPVIRLFGTTADGTHSCVHIHGVFPYFYIPYEGFTADRLAVDKRIYQLATALDKAINVSLARSMSRATHVFKIVLVKGVPIYGYHRKEHNYLKIYMYNPLLVRNATTLLMNGAIPSAMPQVHETHIPYVLQFFIDYNLYGMSFLHLNSAGLRQRTQTAADGADEVPAKMSTSEYEIDALASDILNREPEENDTGEFANPGIASIWKDEETRRRLFGLEQPERMNLSQDDGTGRDIVTESDRYYRAMLAAKLLKEQEGTKENRNPKVPSAYPSEASEDASTLDASCIVDHGRNRHGLSNESLYASQISYHFDASVDIDEEKIVSMSQNIDASLREEDYNLLEIMRELEENEKRNFEDDCLLAPLSQQSVEHRRTVPATQGDLNVSQSNRRLNASLRGDLEALCLMQELENDGAEDARNDSFDSDDEFLLDLTQKQLSTRNVDLESLEGYLNDSGDEDLLVGGCIPQLDGGDDRTGRTPKRNRRSNDHTPDISTLAKRIRIDLTQPTARKSLTPRKVTFAPSPPGEEQATRGEMIRQQFEESSPNTLKKFEIRVPKLNLIKKSILYKKPLASADKTQHSTPLKNLRVCLTKLDPCAYETAEQSSGRESPGKYIADRYRPAYEYDKRNNFNPLEGPSTQQSNRVRKTDPIKAPKGSLAAKRAKLEEQQEIEVVLSERFKNIIRLSPKVLIKPLTMMDNGAIKSQLSTLSPPTTTTRRSVEEPEEVNTQEASGEKDGSSKTIEGTEECSSALPVVDDEVSNQHAETAIDHPAMACEEAELVESTASKEVDGSTEQESTSKTVEGTEERPSTLPVVDDEENNKPTEKTNEHAEMETEEVEPVKMVPSKDVDDSSEQESTNKTVEVTEESPSALTVVADEVGNKPAETAKDLPAMETEEVEPVKLIPSKDVNGSSAKESTSKTVEGTGNKPSTLPAVDDEENKKGTEKTNQHPSMETEEVEPVPPKEVASEKNVEKGDSVTITFDDSSTTDVDDDECMVVDVAENDCVGKASQPSNSAPVPSSSTNPMVTIHLDSDDDSFNDVLKVSPTDLFMDPAEFLECQLDSTPKKATSVPIGSQLDGVVELMGASTSASGKEPDTQTVDEEEDDGNAKNIQSFCETTMVCDVDDIDTDSDDSCRMFPLGQEDNPSESNNELVSISLADCPPTRGDARQAIESFEIPAVVNATPFYSDPNDVTGKKEVGHTVLHITASSLNDLEEFRSAVTGAQSMKHLRYEVLKETYGESIEEVLGPVSVSGPSADRMKELLASERSVTITHAKGPPNRADANAWLDERIRNRQIDDQPANTKDDRAVVELDSPVKVKKAEATMTMEHDGTNVEQVSSASTKIDTESTLNLSVLLTNDENKSSSNGHTTKALETSNKEPPATQNVDVPRPTTSQPCILGSSDQSDLIEHSNANISTATGQDNAYGFKVNYENLQEAKPVCEYNYLTVLAVEIHVPTRGDLRPNPTMDPIAAIFYRIHNDVPPDHPKASSMCGVILNRNLCGTGVGDTLGRKYNQSPYVADVVLVSGERELYEKFLLLIAFWDPDIFTGYEIESVSWGYIIERGYALEMNLMKMLSRVPTVEKVHVSEEEQQELLEMHDYSAGLKIAGRILLDIWRLMRHEIALTSYTFENVVYHILHRRVPSHSYRQLTRLWNKPYSCWIVLDYYLERVNGNFEILNQLDLIGRTAELAKLFGIQFYEVLSRGSQFRVESMMLRIAKPRNFVSVSPTIQQRAHMRAPEYLPLIMEPNSRFYADPIIVLDFQSLYPSVIIAYNYCFSTCLGRIEHLAESTEEFEFGASHLRIPPKMLKALMDKNLITFSPCGIAFVKKRVREGVLPRMLSEILNTRLMVKKSMKLHKTNNVLQRVLHSRQLGLKLIANVTYGYTAANFSGRMPCVEVGDSVVAKGRETLERAIKLVEETERWGAKVVYGDTDSLFVLCPGRTKAEAFRIGEEIAEAVTKDNPPPVKLKLEKVYQPSILQTKKRYVGYMYETADQENPIYEAKGIETVRRDGCPVVAKMLEKVLRILFETCDVSKVKQYTCRQFTKILEGRVNLQDFIFAKEFRGEDGYKPGACVPALELTRKWKLSDPRREPRRGQRVPYVIVNGPPLVPLIRLVRSPDEVLVDEGLKINANYYISKAIIPPLNRCLLLIGADVHQWYNDLPRKSLMLHNTGGGSGVGAFGQKLTGRGNSTVLAVPKKSTISQYFSTTSCIVDCGRQTTHGVCKECQQRPQYALLHVMNKMNKLERKLELTEKMCRSCCQRSFETSCNSLDCPVMFSLHRRMAEHKQTDYYRDLLEQFF